MTPAAFLFNTSIVYFDNIQDEIKVCHWLYPHYNSKESLADQQIRIFHTSNFNLPKCFMNKNIQTKTVCTLLNHANWSQSRVTQHQCQAHSCDICNVLRDPGPIYISKLNNVLCFPKTRFLQMTEMHILWFTRVQI